MLSKSLFGIMIAASLLGATAEARAAETASAGCGLPRLDLSKMRLFGYDAPWTASEWANGGSKIPWHFDHVHSNGETVILQLDAKGAPQLQAVQGTKAELDGLWETDITMPELREGVVVAPLWLYNQDTKDEIDFEFVGRRGLDVSMHAWPGGNHLSKTVRLFAGTDFSGRRLCLGIKSDATAGKVEMLIDGKVIYTWEKGDLDFFVTHPMRPFIEMWAADPSNSGLVGWTGKFTGFKPEEVMVMSVHGYRYSDPGKLGSAGP